MIFPIKIYCCRGNEWNGNTLDEKDKNERTTVWEKYVVTCIYP